MEPLEIWWAMSAVAFRPELQKRLTDDAPEVFGKPADRDAARTLYAALPSETCSTSHQFMTLAGS